MRQKFKMEANIYYIYYKVILQSNQEGYKNQEGNKN